MDNQSTFDRSLLIPISIGGFSVIGIIVVLLIGRSLNSPPEVPVTPSQTHFQYLFLGTEPAITTPLGDGSETPLTGEPVEEEPGAFPTSSLPTADFATPTRPTAGTPNILPPPGAVGTPTGGLPRTGTPTRQVTATLSTPVAANTYDDTDSRFNYVGNWFAQTNVSGAYQNTLHVSDTAGDSVTFQFTGQEIQLYYQAGASLGIITITFDADPLGIPITQSQTSGVWTYTLSTAGSHTVTITHTGGGSVNIDKLVIPGPTVTPSRTPTPTP